MHILRKMLWNLCVGTCLLEPNVATPLDVSITGEVLQILGVCSVPKAFEQIEVFLLWHTDRASVFAVLPEGPPLRQARGTENLL